MNASCVVDMDNNQTVLSSARYVRPFSVKSAWCILGGLCLECCIPIVHVYIAASGAHRASQVV